MTGMQHRRTELSASVACGSAARFTVTGKLQLGWPASARALAGLALRAPAAPSGPSLSAAESESLEPGHCLGESTSESTSRFTVKILIYGIITRMTGMIGLQPTSAKVMISLAFKFIRLGIINATDDDFNNLKKKN